MSLSNCTGRERRRSARRELWPVTCTRLLAELCEPTGFAHPHVLHRVGVTRTLPADGVGAIWYTCLLCTMWWQGLPLPLHQHAAPRADLCLSGRRVSAGNPYTRGSGTSSQGGVCRLMWTDTRHAAFGCRTCLQTNFSRAACRR